MAGEKASGSSELHAARSREGLVLGALLLAQLLLVAHQTQGTPAGGRLSYWAASALVPLQHGFTWAATTARGSWDAYVWQVGAARENERLDSEANRLRIENHRLRGELRNVRARAQLDAIREGFPVETVAARVIGQSAGSAAREVVINRGSQDGVAAGMAVLSPGGIAGKVVASYPAAAMVVLLSDPDSGAGVEFESSGARGVLVGTGGPVGEVAYVESTVPVIPGEAVYTSGTDGVFPRGLPVGTVHEVRPGNGVHRISVRLAAALERLTDVAVVLDDSYQRVPAEVLQAMHEPLPESAAIPTLGADRIKESLRRAFASQQRGVGETGGTPLDIGAALASVSEWEDSGPASFENGE